MVARTAFTQLNYSTLLLIGTILGMFITYLISPIAFLYSLYSLNIPLLIISLITLLLMALSYYPTVKLYQLPIFYSFCLSAIAFLYTLMTIDSAFRHWQGKGGQWKGRVYGN